MNSIKRLALAPVLAFGVASLVGTPAMATSDSLSADAISALAVSQCQADPDVPLSADELAPVVLGEADVDVIPGEITAHVVRLQVNPADPAECTVGVLHRDALLPQVAYEGTATVGGSETEIELGNLGKGGHVDPTIEVELAGSLVPAAEVTADPAYDISLVRKSREVVTVGAGKSEQDAAAKKLKAETRAAADLLRKQQKAAGHGKAAAKALAAAQRVYDKKMAAAQAAYDKAIAPKTVTRPVTVSYEVSGSVAVD